MMICVTKTVFSATFFNKYVNALFPTNPPTIEPADKNKTCPTSNFVPRLTCFNVELILITNTKQYLSTILFVSNYETQSYLAPA